MMYRRGAKLFMFAVLTYTSYSQASNNIILSLSHPSNVARFAPKTKDGLLDKTFGAAKTGKVTTDIGINTDDKAYAMALQADGKIVVAGYSHNGFNNDFVVVRYKTDGLLDSSFGTDGIVITNIDTTIDRSDIAYALKLQPDGKIVVAGIGGANDFAVVRYNTDGS